MKSLHLFALAALSASLVACNSDTSTAQAQQPKPLSEVGIVTLKSQPVTLTTELTGRTTASLTSDVRPQVAGVIKKRLFVEGSQVKAGQPLYLIDPATYQAAVDQAQAALQNAQAAVESAHLKDQRYTELIAIDGVSKQDADDARTAYRQAQASVAMYKAALATARISLDYTTVRAPISGRIGKSSYTPGALVTASQTDALATIRALDPIYVDMTQSSASLLELKKLRANKGMQAGSAEVNLQLEDGSTYAKKGNLKFTEVAVDEATGSVTLRAEFPNPDGTLLPGMYVRAALGAAVESQGILAPQQGIARDPKGGATALVVAANNKLEQRNVTTRRAIDDQWLIATGLQAGDRLVVQGLNKVKAGDTVRVADLDGTAKVAQTSTASSNGVR
jgi:membrane fusion protein (multidrug efflux system)